MDAGEGSEVEEADENGEPLWPLPPTIFRNVLCRPLPPTGLQQCNDRAVSARPLAPGPVAARPNQVAVSICIRSDAAAGEEEMIGEEEEEESEDEMLANSRPPKLRTPKEAANLLDREAQERE